MRRRPHGRRGIEGCGRRWSSSRRSVFTAHPLPDPGVSRAARPHFDVVLSAALVAEHARPLGRYALLSMEHIRRLRQPLDFAIYARACIVARARQPRFPLNLDEIARICGTKQEVAWRTLRRQVLPAFARVCAATGGRIFIQAWCEGDYHGVDHLSCHVGMAGDGISPFHAKAPSHLLRRRARRRPAARPARFGHRVVGSRKNG